MMLPINWQDGAEILFFSTLFYYLALWLRKDKQKNLLWYFYSYCIITLIAYNANLPTATLFLLIFSPVIMTLFVIIHQDILQRNFIALKQITPAQQTNHNWLESLIQTCLIAINNNKSITCILERTDNLHTFLQVPFIIHAPLHTALLEILINGNSYDQHKMVWIDSQGNLEGMNATWKHTIIDNTYHKNSINSEKSMLEDTLAYTTKIDALLFTIDPTTRIFTIIMGGNQLQKMNAHHAYTTIQNYLTNTDTTQQKKGNFNAAHHKNHTNQKYTT